MIDQGRPLCVSCAHFVPEGVEVGHCRRFPPTMFVTGTPNPLDRRDVTIRPSSCWPPVRPNQFCGEHPDFLLWLTRRQRNAAA